MSCFFCELVASFDKDGFALRELLGDFATSDERWPLHVIMGSLCDEHLLFVEHLSVQIRDGITAERAIRAKRQIRLVTDPD